MRRISVVIPSYNHARFLRTTLPSVLTQDYPNLELVIVDDGSSDGSPDLIEELIAGATIANVVFIRQANAGAHAAIMRGIAAASGDVLTILNSDDYYEPGRLSELMRHVPATGDFMVFSQVHFVNMAGERLQPGEGHLLWYDRALREASACPTIGYGLLRNNFSLTSGNLVFTRTLYEAVGGFAHYRLCHDWDFLMKTVLLTEPIFVTKPLMCYRVHDSNTTLSVSKNQEEEEGVAAYSAYFAAAARQAPANPLAPSHHHWPSYFDHFIDAYAPWFSPEPIRKAVGLPPPPPAATWEPWGQAIELAGPDFGYLTTPQPGRQDALAMLRHQALQQAFSPQAEPAAGVPAETPPSPEPEHAPAPAPATPPAPPSLGKRVMARLARYGLPVGQQS